MYMIWNRQIFSASQADAGWRPYACNSAASYDSCHVNHIHFSFSTAGAQMRTSWWSMRPEPDDAPAIERVAAPNRAAMAIKFSRSAFPTRGSADSVFLAAADAPEDAMIASVMAGAAHGAVLLTRGGSDLERRVDRELSRVLSADGSITLVGDQGSLPDELVQAHAGSHPIRRVAGRDALTTARVAGLEMERTGRSRTAVLAGVDALDEALPMVAVAAANDWPLIFTASDELSAEARGFLREADIAQVHIAGSTAAVSDAVRDEVEQLADVTVERHAGENPSRASVAVATYFFALPSAFAMVNRNEIATGAVAAAYAGERRHAPVLLTNGRGVDGEVIDYMISSASPDTGGILVGDTQTVGRQVERQLRRVLGN
jgi:putative cell wall-binding protein